MWLILYIFAMAKKNKKNIKRQNIKTGRKDDGEIINKRRMYGIIKILSPFKLCKNLASINVCDKLSLGWMPVETNPVLGSQLNCKTVLMPALPVSSSPSSYLNVLLVTHQSLQLKKGESAWILSCKPPFPIWDTLNLVTQNALLLPCISLPILVSPGISGLFSSPGMAHIPPDLTIW